MDEPIDESCITNEEVAASLELTERDLAKGEALKTSAVLPEPSDPGRGLGYARVAGLPRLVGFQKHFAFLVSSLLATPQSSLSMSLGLGPAINPELAETVLGFWKEHTTEVPLKSPWVTAQAGGTR
jgi:hypothetical protein